MEQLQAWFSPLIWIFGTIASIAAFVRFCKPVWTTLQSPKQLTETITNLDDKLTKNFADIDARFNKVELALKDLKDFDQLSNEAQVNLLRERISHAYSYYRELGSMSQEEYRSLCDLYEIYQKCGANSYASVMMEQIHALYKEFNK